MCLNTTLRVQPFSAYLKKRQKDNTTMLEHGVVSEDLLAQGMLYLYNSWDICFNPCVEGLKGSQLSYKEATVNQFGCHLDLVVALRKRSGFSSMLEGLKVDTWCLTLLVLTHTHIERVKVIMPLKWIWFWWKEVKLWGCHRGNSTHWTRRDWWQLTYSKSLKPWVCRLQGQLMRWVANFRRPWMWATCMQVVVAEATIREVKLRLHQSLGWPRRPQWLKSCTRSWMRHVYTWRHLGLSSPILHSNKFKWPKWHKGTLHSFKLVALN